MVKQDVHRTRQQHTVHDVHMQCGWIVQMYMDGVLLSLQDEEVV